MSYSSPFTPSSNPQFYPQGSQAFCDSYSQTYYAEHELQYEALSHTASIHDDPWSAAGFDPTLDSAELSNNYLAVGHTALSADFADAYQTVPSSLELAFAFPDEQSGYAFSAHGQDPCSFILSDPDTDTTGPSYPYQNAGSVPASPASPNTLNNAPCGSTFSTLIDALGSQTPVSPGASTPETPPSTYTSPADTPPWSDFGSESNVSSPSSSVYDATLLTEPPTFPLATPSVLSLIPRPLITTPRRNAPVNLRARHAPAPSSSLSANRWKCPFCSYEQTKKRKPDLRRHINTHFSTAEHWVCCGVPLFDTELVKDLPAAVLQREPVLYNGQLMVGGCNQSFSRRDALGRHLHAKKGVCFGSKLAPYLIGNQLGAR
ncbi:hypothetical protein C8Q70DRAFT_1050381 [Cubamyces menziesii]|nr:hypothetical protein C8Q70DRAFT_1050381 [Cubamyces menziesii]